jgi:cell division septation protein DedD
MLRTDENETEILLGNKQLLGIFLVVAVLLGIAFTGGYMAGRGSGKKTALVESSSTEAARSDAGTGGQTHTVSPDAAAPESLKSGEGSSVVDGAGERDQQTAPTSEAPLGARRRNGAKVQPVREVKPESAQAETLPASSKEGYMPQSGSQYLQVVAVERDEAIAIADVLRKKGFRAHAVPKPGNNKLYRVIVGPIRDAGDLRSTRDALHNSAGFREVIVQRY